MNAKALLFLITTLSGFVLTILGAYVTIDNLMTPQGNLFEGVVLFSLGLVTLLMMVIASSLGKTILIFSDVYAKQLDMQKEMSEFYTKTLKGPTSFNDIFGNLRGAGLGNSMTITNLDTGETTSTPLGSPDSLSKINDMILGALGQGQGAKKIRKDIDDMDIAELEKELKKALKNDNFERASEIRDLIKKQKGEDDSSK